MGACSPGTGDSRDVILDTVNPWTVNIGYRDVTAVTGELSLNATIGYVNEELTGYNRDVMLSYVHYVN